MQVRHASTQPVFVLTGSDEALLCQQTTMQVLQPLYVLLLNRRFTWVAPPFLCTLHYGMFVPIVTTFSKINRLSMYFGFLSWVYSILTLLSLCYTLHRFGHQLVLVVSMQLGHTHSICIQGQHDSWLVLRYEMHCVMQLCGNPSLHTLCICVLVWVRYVWGLKADVYFYICIYAAAWRAPAQKCMPAYVLPIESIHVAHVILQPITCIYLPSEATAPSLSWHFPQRLKDGATRCPMRCLRPSPGFRVRQVLHVSRRDQTWVDDGVFALIFL